ncbi:MAG TPA: CoA-binding protein [Vicinamibacteria bacterium]|nr:CoA-binding protein [Vicinamibacteria bacterium]
MAHLDPEARSFLSCRRLAVVGVSRDPRSFSRAMFAELRRRGYEAVPVNPIAAGDVEGVSFVRRVTDISPPPEGALLLTPPAITEQVVKDCAAGGIRRVWMHRGLGTGAASPAALAYCAEHGIEVVADACPFMFLPRAGFVHRAHGWWRARSGRARPAGTGRPAFRP